MKDPKWAALARNDLASIDRYHRQDHINVADDLTQRIVDAAGFLANTPFAGPVSRGGNRKWRVAGTQYIVFYRPTATGVRVLRILHSARDNARS